MRLLLPDADAIVAHDLLQLVVQVDRGLVVVLLEDKARILLQGRVLLIELRHGLVLFAHAFLEALLPASGLEG